MGIGRGFSRNNLAHANEQRDWRIYRDTALLLLRRARECHANEPLGITLHSAVYAFDSSTIDLCLSLFPWARFLSTKAGVKIHTCVDVRGNIPTFMRLTEAASSDVGMLDTLPVEPGAFYLLDRAYLDFARLYAMSQAGAFFVTRAPKDTRFRRSLSRPVDKSLGLRSDQTGRLCGGGTLKTYPAPLRRVTFRDPETGRRLCFLTNRMDIPALDVCLLYKKRWQVELFFKWVKQHLRIKHFLGTSSNAVHIQIWIALAAYALVAIVVKERRLRLGMYEILQFLSVSIFEKIKINDVFNTSLPATLPEPSLFQGNLL
jgi:hypothetical protein